MNDDVHEWDGAYVLGALEPQERRRFEEHLPGCARCAASVQAMAGLPGILGRVDREEAQALRDAPDDEAERAGRHVPDRAAGVARRVRSRRRRVRLLTALVVVGVLAGESALGWTVVRALQPAATQQAVVERVLQPVGRSGLSARLTATSLGWGTRLDWSCDYRPAAGDAEERGAPAGYSLVVRTVSGSTTTVATWTSDAGEAAGLTASTAIPADAIASIDIRPAGSTTPLASTGF